MTAANFDENSPNARCSLRRSMSPNAAASQNVVVPPLPSEHLVAVGEREQRREALARPAGRPTGPSRDGGSCRGIRARRRPGRDGLGADLRRTGPEPAVDGRRSGGQDDVGHPASLRTGAARSPRSNGCRRCLQRVAAAPRSPLRTSAGALSRAQRAVTRPRSIAAERVRVAEREERCARRPRARSRARTSRGRTSRRCASRRGNSENHFMMIRSRASRRSAAPRNTAFSFWPGLNLPRRA